MTALEAIQLLGGLCEKIRLTWEDHQTVKEAINLLNDLVVHSALCEKPDGENKDKCDGK
ncbi:MAG TPA: hypothetical protein VLH56_08495 [Dissulfurispiraceae bacterium]|nr:hypothetical protein [Dissulfurispiraceae bacterium]